MKSRRDVRLEYRGELYTLADKAMRGKLSPADMAKAHRELVKVLGREMYLEALKVNGILEDEIDTADEEEIQGWVATQLPHVSQFARDAAAAKADNEKNDIAKRIDLWVAALDVLGQLGYASAAKNAMVVWKYGDTEHCEDCLRLNGQQHRTKWFIKNGWIPREPGGKMACGGWSCKCGCYDVKTGKRVL
jgi:hypothetical protein